MSKGTTSKEFGHVRECAPCGRQIKRVRFSMATGDFCQGPEVPLCEKCGGKEYPRMEDLWTAIKVRVNSGAYYIPELGKGKLPEEEDFLDELIREREEADEKKAGTK